MEESREALWIAGFCCGEIPHFFGGKETVSIPQAKLICAGMRVSTKFPH